MATIYFMLKMLRTSWHYQTAVNAKEYNKIRLISIQLN